MLLSVFFTNGPRPIPDIAHCSRKMTNVDGQLMAPGRAEPGQHAALFSPARGEDISTRDLLSILGPAAEAGSRAMAAQNSSRHALLAHDKHST